MLHTRHEWSCTTIRSGCPKVQLLGGESGVPASLRLNKGPNRGIRRDTVGSRGRARGHPCVRISVDD